MDFLNIIKEIFLGVDNNKVSSNSDHESFMKLMHWGCYNDVTDSRN
ncbi:MAG: hypothetical protein U9Q04_07320 [Campylobacterota bacterium]|nr:hypothetical protein [Campylobacterota bacterium]